MISTDLTNIADWLAGHASRGDSLGPQTLGVLALQLLDLSRQAAQLETRQIETTAEILGPARRRSH